MMGWIWVGMLAISVVCALLTGNLGALTPAAMEGAQAGVTLCVNLAGALCLWCGFARVMQAAGWSDKLGRLLRPVLRKLFPKASRDPEALGYLSANVSANLLGLGNAATPMGIQAVKRMQTLSGSRAASDEMCLLVVLNTASIQLLPTTVAALRASLGAASPFDILGGVWLCSICSVSAGLLAARVLRRA